jgi:hypothetical protein
MGSEGEFSDSFPSCRLCLAPLPCTPTAAADSRCSAWVLLPEDATMTLFLRRMLLLLALRANQPLKTLPKSGWATCCLFLRHRLRCVRLCARLCRAFVCALVSCVCVRACVVRLCARLCHLVPVCISLSSAGPGTCQKQKGRARARIDY